MLPDCWLVSGSVETARGAALGWNSPRRAPLGVFGDRTDYVFGIVAVIRQLLPEYRWRLPRAEQNATAERRI